ncbi:peptidoglycan DD-metalloendopeptidase family protein, partial [Nesterenkonia suensis]
MAPLSPSVPGGGAALPATGMVGALDGVDLTTNRSATDFRMPLASGSYRYSSEYGPRCIPIQGGSTNHLGQDLGASEGSPIYAVAQGTVVRTFSGNRYNSGYVVLQHQIDGKTFHSAYYHMWNANTHVRVGQTVNAGQTIALVGNSGPSTAPHLHLEIWEGAWLTGTSHNPTTWLAQRGVDLRGNAQRVLNLTTPSSCTYYTAQDTQLRAAASSGAQMIAQLPRGTEMTSVPGDMSNGMVRVQVNGRSGWVAHPHITPTQPNVSAGDSGSTTGSDSGSSGSSVAGTYRTTTGLNARADASMRASVVTVLNRGA